MANPYIPIPAPVPPPPQVTLVGSSLPGSGAGADPSTKDPPDLSGLPSDLRDELNELADGGDVWVRGFQYAPENHWDGEVRDACDFTTVDQEQLPAPTGLAITPHAGGGTLSAASHAYVVTALNANGETNPSAEVTHVNILNDSNTITWAADDDTSTYKVYGRVHGSLGLLGTVGPFDTDETPSFLDDGSISPGAAPPIDNTTGGPGSYGNLAIVQYQPFLVVNLDECSAFGFLARDYKGRAERLLENSTYSAIEKEFWRGDLAQAKGYPNNYLANDEDTRFFDATPGGGPPSIARGQQILQDYIANQGFGGQGMIHVQAQSTGNLLNVRRIGNKMYDIFDNLVVPGVGYDGTGPDNATPADGTAWIFATDMVTCRVQKQIRIFPDPFSEAFDWGQGGEPNTITFRAERFVAASWDGFVHAACRVTLAT